MVLKEHYNILREVGKGINRGIYLDTSFLDPEEKVEFYSSMYYIFNHYYSDSVIKKGGNHPLTNHYKEKAEYYHLKSHEAEKEWGIGFPSADPDHKGINLDDHIRCKRAPNKEKVLNKID